MENSALGDRCWFCQEEKPGEILPLAVTLTKKDDKKLTKLIRIPSCVNCNTNHRKLARIQTWYTLIGFVPMLAFWVYVIITMIKTDQPSYLFMIVISFIFFFIYTSILDKTYIDRMKNKGTQPQSHINEHPEIQGLVDQGWRVGRAKIEK